MYTDKITQAIAEAAKKILEGEKLHPNQQKIDVVDDEKIDGKDFAKLRAMKKEDVEQIDELSQGLLRKASAASYRKSSASHGIASQEKQKVSGTAERFASDHENLAAKKLGQANKFRAAADAKVKNEEVEQIDEVDHPKNQADMLAHIMHQIKVSGHPVATDAQFRATHGKDETKKASLEPGQDKVQYAIAQGGNVKP